MGGILVGRDLIGAAAVRAQISQIEKYNSAVNTFRGKYNNYLPGDIPDPDASRFGFAARGGYAGAGNGDGVIEGLFGCGNGCNTGFAPATGEAGEFWVDLTYANGLNLNLIDGSFRAASPTSSVAYAGSTMVPQYLPQAKIGRGNYLYVWSGGASGGGGSSDGINYYGLSAVSQLSGWPLFSTPGLTVSEAAAIDKKMDDGLPQSGKVMAWYYNYNVDNYHPAWAAGGGAAGANASRSPTTAATAGSATTCYDNGNVTGPQQYSLTQNNGTGVNCALSFQFQ